MKKQTVQQHPDSHAERKMENPKIDKAMQKALRKEGRPIGLSLILYILITNVVGLAIALPGLLITHTMGQFLEIAQFAASIIGLGFLFFYFRRKVEYKAVFKKEKRMTPGDFSLLLCLFIGFSTVALFFYQSFEESVQQIGYSLAPRGLETLLNSDSLFILLSVWIIAPVGEELIFRGFLMRYLEKYGKLTAIVVTALLFGLFHGNLGQGLNAFAVGLVLGYVAIEYSVVWSIVLHWVNNFVFCSLLPDLLGGIRAMAPISTLFALICLAVSAAVLVKRRTEVAAWFRANPAEENTIGCLLSSGWTSLFLLLHIAGIILCIHPL